MNPTVHAYFAELYDAWTTRNRLAAAEYQLDPFALSRITEQGRLSNMLGQNRIDLDEYTARRAEVRGWR